MIVAVDTNVFIYWLDRQSPFHTEAKHFLNDAIKQNYELVCSTLVYTEFLSKPGTSKHGLAELSIKWVAPELPISQKAGELRQVYANLQSPDAIHIATAIETKAARFVTNDLLIVGYEKIENVVIQPLSNYKPVNGI